MILRRLALCLFFFFNDTATTEIYTLSLHDALPIFRTTCRSSDGPPAALAVAVCLCASHVLMAVMRVTRSEEHTSELQSPCNIVCRLLLEKKNGSQPADMLGIILMKTVVVAVPVLAL